MRPGRMVAWDVERMTQIIPALTGSARAEIGPGAACLWKLQPRSRKAPVQIPTYSISQRLDRARFWMGCSRLAWSEALQQLWAGCGWGRSPKQSASKAPTALHELGEASQSPHARTEAFGEYWRNSGLSKNKLPTAPRFSSRTDAHKSYESKAPIHLMIGGSKCLFRAIEMLLRPQRKGSAGKPVSLRLGFFSDPPNWTRS